MFKKFRTDPLYLGRYYTVSVFFFALLLFSIIFIDENLLTSKNLAWLLILVPLYAASLPGILISNLLGLYFCLKAPEFNIELYHFLLIAIAIYAGALHTSLLHNLSHENIKPKWFNRVLGEIFASYILTSFPGFTILHIQHHAYPDDDRNDPIYPHDRSFIAYLAYVKVRLRNVFFQMYKDKWGIERQAKSRLNYLKSIIFLDRLLKALCLFLIFGPVGLCVFYLPSFLSSQFVFAHVSYYTHQKEISAQQEKYLILNLNSSLWERIRNYLTIGIYSHKDHHDQPQVFNPLSTNKES